MFFVCDNFHHGGLDKPVEEIKYWKFQRSIVQIIVQQHNFKEIWFASKQVLIENKHTHVMETQ